MAAVYRIRKSKQCKQNIGKDFCRVSVDGLVF